jgi:hypothetical protein
MIQKRIIKYHQHVTPYQACKTSTNRGRRDILHRIRISEACSQQLPVELNQRCQLKLANQA